MRHVFTLFLLTCYYCSAEMRTWTSDDGKEITAEILNATEENVTLKLKNRRTYDLPLERLSEGDKEYVRQYLEEEKEAEVRRKLSERSVKESDYEDHIKGEWVVIPKEKYGVPFHLYGTSKLGRLKEPFPLFIHLHGAGARTETPEVGKVEIAAKRLAREEQYEETPCLIICPVCPPDTFWGAHVEALETMVDSLVKELPIDQNRIYLSGYSMGSRGISSLLKSRPKFYAAAMLADGKADPTWVEKVDTALWLWFSGERELEGARAIMKDYVAAGKNGHFEGYPEFTHNQIHWKLAHDEDVFPWIFSQTREKIK